MFLVQSVFSEKTLSELIINICIRLEAITGKIVKLSQYKDACTVIGTIYRKEICIGAYSHRVEELKRYVVFHGVSDDKVKSDILALEYMANAGEIFNEVLLNRECAITRENIDDIENFVLKRLSYFSDWKIYQQALKRRKTDGWGKMSIAHQTWLNLRITSAGFFGYAHSILQED